MAFKTSIIGDRFPAARTYLEAVQRVVRATGLDAPSSITGAVPNHIGRAKAAVDDALQRAYNACLWDFRGRWGYLELEDDTVWYALPGDWVARATDAMVMRDSVNTLGNYNVYGPIPYLDYKRLLGEFPDLPLPVDSQIAEGGSVYVQRVTQVRPEHRGIPKFFTIHGDLLGVWPVPHSDLEDDYDFSMSVPWLISYWGSQKDLTENEDTIPLPQHLLVPMHWLALAYFKQSQEYGDFQADEARGEGLLANEVAKEYQKQGDAQVNMVVEGYGGV